MKKRGRPKKSLEDKEKAISIRFSPVFLAAIKNAAQDEGLPWQTFIKQTIAKELKFDLR